MSEENGVNKLSEKIKDFLVARDFTHEETTTISYKIARDPKENRSFYSYNRPKPDPDGAFDYSYDETKVVADVLDNEQVDRLIQLDNNAMLREQLSQLSKLDEAQKNIIEASHYIASNVRTIKGCVVFFTILTAVNIVSWIILISKLT